jgi:hypothetical protein
MSTAFPHSGKNNFAFDLLSVIFSRCFSSIGSEDIVKLYGLSNQVEQIGYEIAPPGLQNMGCDGLFYYHFKMP